MLDFETVSAISREILRNHDRHRAESMRKSVRTAPRLEPLAKRLTALPAWVACAIGWIRRRG